MKESIVQFEEIKRVLPHRYPFLLIDRVFSVDEGRIRALKNVTANEPFFNGHFPEMAVMPGVLQIEAMAQASGLILALSQLFDVKKEIAFLASVGDAKFKKIICPGDQLIIEAKVAARRKSIIKFTASITVDGAIASSSTLTLAIKSL